MVGVPLPLQLQYTIMHVDGVDNNVVDYLSYYYENDMSDNTHLENTYVNTDIWLDPDGKLLPTNCYMELHAAATRRSKCLAKRQESHHIKAEILNAGDKKSPPLENTSSTDDVTTIAADNGSKSLWTHIEETMNLQAIIKNTYCKDMICAKIITQPDAHPMFGIWEGLIWTKNQPKCDVICILWDTFQRGRRLIEMIIDHAHQIIGHYGQWKTSNYIWCSYWWPQMATGIEAFCRSCRKCQTNKTNTQKPQGFLHSFPILDKPWQSLGMDYVGPLPQSQGNDYLLVIIDQLTSQVHLVPTMTWVTAKEVAWPFLKEIVRLHGVPKSIVSDHDTKFMSMFWHELHKLMGTKLLMSTVFHPQTDGATEQAYRSLGQILRMIIHDDQRDWAAKCPMVEFVLNSASVQQLDLLHSSWIRDTCPRSECQHHLTPHSRVSSSLLYKWSGI